MTALIALIRKDLILYLNDKRALLLHLLMPVVLAAFFGSLFGGSPESSTHKLDVGLVVLDQSDAGKGTNLLVGSEKQITEMLKRYKEAGLTMPMLWPPFADVPVAKTLDDLKRVKEEIMPKVDAM